MIIKTDLEDYPGGPVVKIHLAVQGMQVQSLVGDPNTTCRRATMPATTEPMSHE